MRKLYIDSFLEKVIIEKFQWEKLSSYVFMIPQPEQSRIIEVLSKAKVDFSMKEVILLKSQDTFLKASSFYYSMPKLTAQKCLACEGGVPLLMKTEYFAYLKEVPQWKVINEKRIEREFQCKNFKKALEFVNKVGAIAEKESHHPDIFLHSWNNVKITLYTHMIGGLSKNDFIVAAKIDNLSKKK